MYVVGTDEFNFIHIIGSSMSDRLALELSEVQYDCALNKASIFTCQETAQFYIDEIKRRKDEIAIENYSVLRSIIDGESENQLDIDSLKIFELIPKEVKPDC